MAKAKTAKALKDMTAVELRSLLTDRQISFVEGLVSGLDATSAAVLAGYAEKSAAQQASKMLKNDKVAAYRRARYIELYDKVGVSPEWVGLKLVEIVERCMEATPHLVWDSSKKEYVPDGTWNFDANGATKALSAIGKSLGMFSDKPQAKTEQEGVEAFLARMEGGRKF